MKNTLEDGRCIRRARGEDLRRFLEIGLREDDQREFQFIEKHFAEGLNAEDSLCKVFSSSAPSLIYERNGLPLALFGAAKAPAPLSQALGALFKVAPEKIALPWLAKSKAFGLENKALCRVAPRWVNMFSKRSKLLFNLTALPLEQLAEKRATTLATRWLKLCGFEVGNPLLLPESHGEDFVVYPFIKLSKR